MSWRKKNIFTTKPLLFFLCSSLYAFKPLINDQIELPNDQLAAIFGSSYYVTFMVCDFAHHHGYRYLKILSFQFKGFENTIQGSCKNVDKERGRYFELKDDMVNVSFICYTHDPGDPYIIDTEKYRGLFIPSDDDD